jgi:hypothetical protein
MSDIHKMGLEKLKLFKYNLNFLIVSIRMHIMIIQFCEHVLIQSDLFRNIIRKTTVYAIKGANITWNTELILYFFKSFFILFLLHVYFVIYSLWRPTL